MNRIKILAILGVLAAVAAGCADSGYDRDYGYHHGHYWGDRDDRYSGDYDRPYWRGGGRFCRGDNGDEYAC